jgi:hypothetical protein
MKKLFPIITGLAALALFTGCFYPATVPYPQGNPYGYQGPGNVPPGGPGHNPQSGTYGAPDGTTYGAPYGQPGPGQPGYGGPLESDPDLGPNAPEQPAPDPQPTQPDTSGEDLPIYPNGIPIEGEPGLARSPYTDEGMVNVEGLPSGSPVRCPFTGGIFLVP